MSQIYRSRENTREQAEGEAREWFLLQQERELNASEQEAFEAWAQEDILHQECFQQLHQIWNGLAEAAALAQAPQRQPSGILSWHQKISAWFSGGVFSDGFFSSSVGAALNMRWAIASVAATVIVVSAVWITAVNFPVVPAPQVYSTGISEVKEIPLSDGSLVTLGADSRMLVDFQQDSRHVSLSKGQAFFDVAKNREKPFYVATHHATVRVVGTRFEVYQNLDQVKVSVEEGVVEVVRNAVKKTPELLSNDTSSIKNALDKRVLTAGHQVRTSAQIMGEVTELNDLEVASWRQGRLVYRDAQLSDVIADVNRYRQGEILLGTEPLKHVRITTSFSVEQVDTVVSMLEKSLPLSVHYESEGRVLILPKTRVQ